jgi:protein TonB
MPDEKAEKFIEIENFAAAEPVNEEEIIKEETAQIKDLAKATPQMQKHSARAATGAGTGDSAKGKSAGGAAGGIGEGTGDGSGEGIGSGEGDSTGEYREAAGVSSDGAGDTADIGALADAFAARVDALKKYPYMAVRRNQTGRVVLFIQIAADGSLMSAAVQSSSGVASLDESALSAAAASCPFSHGAGRAIEFAVPIRYDLN